MVAKRLNDYKVAWEEVRRRRSQYRQLSIQLDSLRETIENDLREGMQLMGVLVSESIITNFFIILAYLVYIFIYFTDQVTTIDPKKIELWYVIYQKRLCCDFNNLFKASDSQFVVELSFKRSKADRKSVV